MKVKQQDPETPEQWQEAVDMAEVLVGLDSAKQYGLVTGGPEVNVERCLEILRRGRARGVVPSPDAFDRCMPLLVGEVRREG